MNWFESGAGRALRRRRREIVHTQFLVAFGRSSSSARASNSRHPAFDPLSLAVDWYWNGNLALQTWLFDEIPIEPYDHAAGFGSEDWHWSCNTLAAGIPRVVIPGTCYYYRIKPAKMALGRVGEVIHKRARPVRAAPPCRRRPPSPSARRPPVSRHSPEFFARRPRDRDVRTGRLLAARARGGRPEGPAVQAAHPAAGREDPARGAGERIRRRFDRRLRRRGSAARWAWRRPRAPGFGARAGRNRSGPPAPLYR